MCALCVSRCVQSARALDAGTFPPTPTNLAVCGRVPAPLPTVREREGWEGSRCPTRTHSSALPAPRASPPLPCSNSGVSPRAFRLDFHFTCSLFLHLQVVVRPAFRDSSHIDDLDATANLKQATTICLLAARQSARPSFIPSPLFVDARVLHRQQHLMDALYA